jgi:hypothetical protein
LTYSNDRKHRLEKEIAAERDRKLEDARERRETETRCRRELASAAWAR